MDSKFFGTDVDGRFVFPTLQIFAGYNADFGAVPHCSVGDVVSAPVLNDRWTVEHSFFGLIGVHSIFIEVDSIIRGVDIEACRLTRFVMETCKDVLCVHPYPTLITLSHS
jgi:hypothetical protein